MSQTQDQPDTYAIIEESGGQRIVRDGETILIDLLKSGEAAEGESITFDKVLTIGEQGGTATIGTPYVPGATVTAEVVDPRVKGEKLYIYKRKPKKGYKRKTGHRQQYTAVKVTALNS